MAMLVILETRWLNLARNKIEKLDFDQMTARSPLSCETFVSGGCIPKQED